MEICPKGVKVGDRADAIDCIADALEYASPTFLEADPIRTVYVGSFTIGDVAEVCESSIRCGDYAEESLVALIRLKDGRYAAMDGGCDTTGWDCQSWCDIRIGSYSDVMRYGFDDDARRRLRAGRAGRLGEIEV